MTEQPKTPLWRVMDRHSPLLNRRDWNTVLRALADWLVPDESSETFLPGEDSHNRSQRQHRRHLRATLLIEAAKAEAGE